MLPLLYLKSTICVPFINSVYNFLYMPFGRILEGKINRRAEADRTLVGEREVKLDSFGRKLKKRNEGVYDVWGILKIFESGRTERVTRTGPFDEHG